MARLRYDGLATGSSAPRADLTLGGSGLTNSATSVTFSAALTHAGGTAVPTISGSDYIPLAILDANGHVAEVVYLTAYTTAGTTGTIARGKEGTSGVAHSAGARIVCGPTVEDVRFVGVKAYRTTSYSLANTSATMLPWDAEEYDTDGFHDNSTNPSRLTVPAGKDGYYFVQATIGSDVNFASTRLFVQLFKNGTAIRAGNQELNSVSAQFPMVQATAVVYLAAGDYVESQYYQTSGSTRNLYLAPTGFTMYRIGL